MSVDCSARRRATEGKGDGQGDRDGGGRHKSGFARPGDVEFEDFSQPMNRVPSDSSLGTPSDGRPELRGTSRSRAKRWPFGKKNKVGAGALSVEGWV